MIVIIVAKKAKENERVLRDINQAFSKPSGLVLDAKPQKRLEKNPS